MKAAYAIALAAVLAGASPASAADGTAAAADVVVEMVRTIGLPTALLLLVWWERRQERAQAHVQLETLRTEHSRERAEWAARLEARHDEHTRLAREVVEDRAELTAELRRIATAHEESASASERLAAAVVRVAAPTSEPPRRLTR